MYNSCGNIKCSFCSKGQEIVYLSVLTPFLFFMKTLVFRNTLWINQYSTSYCWHFEWFVFSNQFYLIVKYIHMCVYYSNIKSRDLCANLLCITLLFSSILRYFPSQNWHNFEILLNIDIKYKPSVRPLPRKFLWWESNNQFIAD